MKTTKTFMLVAFVLLLLVGCTESRDAEGTQMATPADTAAGSGAGDKAIEVEFAHSEPVGDFDKMIAAYNKSQDKVRVKTTLWGSTYDELMEKLQAKAVAGQLPDLYANGLNYLQFGINSFPVVPVQTFIDKEKYDLSDYYPKLLDLTKGPDRKLYGLPFKVGLPILFYNEEMFKEAGLDPANPPKTWEEMRDAAKKLTKGDRYGIFMDPTNSYIFQILLENAGGRMMKDDKHVGFNSPEGKQALQLLHDLYEVDKSMPILSYNQAEQSFLAGKISMYIQSSTRIVRFNEGAPFKVGTSIVPSVDGAIHRAIAGGSTMLITARDPKKQEAAWDFIKFLSSPEGSTLYAQNTGNLTVRKSAFEKPELMGDYIKNTANAATPYLAFDDATPWTSYPGVNQARIDEALKNNIVAAVQKQKTIDQALADAEKQANELLK